MPGRGLSERLQVPLSAGAKGISGVEGGESRSSGAGALPGTAAQGGPGSGWPHPLPSVALRRMLPLTARTEPLSDQRPQLSIFSALMKAACGISTLPNWRIFFLPAFCFSRSLRLRVASPP